MFNPVFQKNILSMKPDWAFLLDITCYQSSVLRSCLGQQCFCPGSAGHNDFIYYGPLFPTHQDYPGGSDGKASVYNRTWVRSLGWEDSLEKETATHSSTLALKIPWMEELGAGYCPWGRKELGMTE